MNTMTHDFPVEQVLPAAQYQEDVDPLTRYFRSRSSIQKLAMVVGFPAAIALLSIGTALWGIGRVENIAQAGGSDLAAAIHGVAQLVQTVVALTIIAGLAVLGASMKILYTDVIVTVRSLLSTMRHIANGDHSVIVPARNRVDEYGEMAEAIEAFRLHAIALQQTRAERDRVTSAQGSDVNALADRFEKTISHVVASVSSASTQLHTTAGEWAQNAELSHTETDRVVTASQEASSGSTSAAAASDEFAMSIGEISRQAATSAELARAAADSADEADAAISQLSLSADQVGQIVELIQSIAQRTNLLALNASIEAARGGEAGRGFAVVASEVKELATQTSKATGEVADQIRAMQNSTGTSVSVLRALNKQIQELETTAISIATAVDQQSVAGQDLARSIDIAARSTDEVANRIGRVRDMAVTTGKAASQVRESSDELAGQAQLLRGHVDSFLREIRAS